MRKPRANIAPPSRNGRKGLEPAGTRRGLTEGLSHASGYKDTRGKVLAVITAAGDVTAQRQLERDTIEQRNQERDRLADLERFQKLTVGREPRSSSPCPHKERSTHEWIRDAG